VVEVGETYEYAGIKLRIVEGYRYRRRSGIWMIRIACMIIDDEFTTPVFHFWLREDEDVGEKIKQVIEHYKQTRGILS